MKQVEKWTGAQYQQYKVKITLEVCANQCGYIEYFGLFLDFV